MPDPQPHCPQPSSGSKFPASPLPGQLLPSSGLVSLWWEGRVGVWGERVGTSFPPHSPAETLSEKGESTPSFYLRKWRPRESSHLSKVTLQIRAPANLEQEVWPGAICEPLSCPHILPPTNKRPGLHFHLCFLPPTEVLNELRNKEVVQVLLVLGQHWPRRKRNGVEDFPKIFLLGNPLPQWREMG